METSDTFKDYYRSALGQVLSLDKISQASTDILNPVLTGESISKISEKAISHVSSFGIGIALALPGPMVDEFSKGTTENFGGGLETVLLKSTELQYWPSFIKVISCPKIVR